MRGRRRRGKEKDDTREGKRKKRGAQGGPAAKEKNMGQIGEYVCDYCGIVFKGRKEHDKIYCSFSCYNKAREKEYKKKFVDFFGGIYDFIAVKDGYVIFECKICKQVFKRKAKQIFYSNTGCPNCKNNERQHIIAIKNLIKGLNKVAARKETQHAKERMQEEKRKARALIRYKHVCVECGREFESHSRVKNYCSKKCVSKKFNKIKELKRGNRIKNNGRVDKDITIERIIKRDNNICYLCGGECDIGDYKIVNGVFIAGLRYPSIDHIKPLSKGGTHTWDNVKLAHRDCNTQKGARQSPAGT